MRRDEDGVWGVFAEGVAHQGVLYSLRVEGPPGPPAPRTAARGLAKQDGVEAQEDGGVWAPGRPLLDPYAPLVAGRDVWGEWEQAEGSAPGGASGNQWLGTFDFSEEPFDWGAGYRRPGVAWEDLVIYECSVRLFTANPNSGIASGRRGSFLGLADKVGHLKRLGVTAVELLPVFEYDELELQAQPNPRDHMTNTWGYSTLNFFAPMSRFAVGGGGAHRAAREFKEMVRRLHSENIEVILDVVYNHTSEGGENVVSFRGIDSRLYYMHEELEGGGMGLMNFSGCGNTLNANHPIVVDLIIDSLRHWVEHYHVDGFRFDLASALCRGENGEPLPAPPLIRAISKDPVLLAHNTKLISEPWDCGGLYQVGSFPNWDVWGEWNGKFRDAVRGFIKGDDGLKGDFARRISGSSDLYLTNNRRPYHSINFVIAHDGFTLRDLVSYNEKHNGANGEQNRDGANDNFSWNCGHEGSEGAPRSVENLRARQMRNLHLALMLSQGTPMVMMGDEYGRSTGGNNNTYGIDSPLTWFDWDALQREVEGEGGSFFDFFCNVIEFRRTQPLLRRRYFLGPADITWHETQWDNPESKFLAFTLHDRDGGGDIYAAFNAHVYFVEATLPHPPQGKHWFRVADTNLPPPKDFDPKAGRKIEGRMYNVAPFSSIVMVAK